MYVTRPLSQLLKSPESLMTPLEGPSSGYLVIQDEESETYSCFGLCKKRSLKELPFPQNKELTVRYTTTSGQSSHVSLDPVFLIPVPNRPLSSNHYYAIVPHGKRKGEAYMCSREEDKKTCCFCRCIKDVKPRPLDPNNVYQQFEIVPYEGICSPRGVFVANSLASDGFPPYFLRREGWDIYTKTPDNFKLDTARGLDSRLRAGLPEFNFSVSQKSCQPLVVGKWYSPFMFVKEGTLRDQVERAMYYEVTLEQRWEQIFNWQRDSKQGNVNSVTLEQRWEKIFNWQRDGKQGNVNSVVIDTSLEREEVFINGNKAMWNEKNVVDGVIWFTSSGVGRVGLRVELVERMKWEENRGGFISGEERAVKINKVEDMKENGTEFGCYVLVERFNFKRMDSSLALSYDFKHFHQIKTKWE